VEEGSGELRQAFLVPPHDVGLADVAASAEPRAHEAAILAAGGLFVLVPRHEAVTVADAAVDAVQAALPARIARGVLDRDPAVVVAVEEAEGHAPGRPGHAQRLHRVDAIARHERGPRRIPRDAGPPPDPPAPGPALPPHLHPS